MRAGEHARRRLGNMTRGHPWPAVSTMVGISADPSQKLDASGNQLMKSRFNVAVAGALCVVEAHGRDLYPPKPVFLIVPFATGVQSAIVTPFGTYMKPRRTGEPPAP